VRLAFSDKNPKYPGSPRLKMKITRGKFVITIKKKAVPPDLLSYPLPVRPAFFG
jgi:hypothetical protein